MKRKGDISVFFGKRQQLTNNRDERETEAMEVEVEREPERSESHDSANSQCEAEAEEETPAVPSSACPHGMVFYDFHVLFQSSVIIFESNPYTTTQVVIVYQSYSTVRVMF